MMLHCKTVCDIALEDRCLEEAKDSDWKQLKLLFLQLRTAYAVQNTDQFLLRLVALDNFTRRFQVKHYPGLTDSGIGDILLDLACLEDRKVRDLALSCLANFTHLVPGFFAALSEEKINHVLTLNFSVEGGRCLENAFRWFGNILVRGEDAASRLFAIVTVDQIYEASIECVLSEEANIKPVVWLFYRMALLPLVSAEIVQKCVEFFYLFLRSPRRQIYSLIFSGIHSLISNDHLAFHLRLKIVEDLGLVERMPSILPAFNPHTGPKAKHFLFFALLGDLFELRLSAGDLLIPQLMDFLHICNQNYHDYSKTERYIAYLYESLLKIAKYSGFAEMMWTYNHQLVMVDLMMGIQEGCWDVKHFAIRCMFLFMETVKLVDLVDCLRRELMELLIDVVSNDDIWIKDFVVCFRRLLECAEVFKKGFAEYFREIDGKERLEEVLERNSGSAELSGLMRILSDNY
jgi:hypothetical protein